MFTAASSREMVDHDGHGHRQVHLPFSGSGGRQRAAHSMRAHTTARPHKVNGAARSHTHKVYERARSHSASHIQSTATLSHTHKVYGCSSHAASSRHFQALVGSTCGCSPVLSAPPGSSIISHPLLSFITSPRVTYGAPSASLWSTG